MKRRWKWLRNVLIIALLLGGGWYFQFGREKPVEYVTEAAKQDDVQKLVEVTGSVESDQLLTLRFKNGGQLDMVNVEVGDRIEADQMLGALDARFLAIDIEKAEAALAAAQAELSLLYAGPTNATKEISRTEVDQAEQSLSSAAIVLLNTKDSNEAKLQKAKQEVENAKTDVQSAELALANAQKTSGKTEEKADKTLTDKYENTRTAVATALDALSHALTVTDEIIGDTTSEQKERQVALGFRDQQAKITAKNTYKQSLADLDDLKEQLASLNSDSTNEELTAFLDTTEARLLAEKTLIDTVDKVLDASKDGAYLTDTDLDGFRTLTKTEKTALNTEISSIRTTRQQITTAELEVDTSKVTTTSSTDTAEAALTDKQNRLKIAEAAYKELETASRIAVSDTVQEIKAKKLLAQQAENNLEKTLEKPRSVDTRGAEARIMQMQASLSEAHQSYDDMFLTAPMSGVVTEVNKEAGENITPADGFITMMTDNLQIKANISESDIAAVALEDPVEITFDALPGEAPMTGSVAAIDPAETVIQGVIYYQATISLNAPDERIKSGMTADLSILADQRNNVVTVTPEAIQYEEDVPFVFILGEVEKSQTGLSRFLKPGSGTKTIDKIHRNITLGLEGEDSVEIKEGLSEGERVVLYEKDAEK